MHSPGRSSQASRQAFTVVIRTISRPQCHQLVSASTQISHPKMLHIAVADHKRQAAGEQKENVKSSPPLQSSQPTKFLRDNGILTTSDQNARRKFQPPLLNQGVKRMSNGLAKSLSMSFEDDLKSIPSSQRRSPGKKIETIVIDENDFDSDVDLDVEEPRPAFTRPTLPAPAKSVIPAKAMLSPTQPRQQATYHNFDIDKELLGSSAPVDWSSSPAQHFQPKQQYMPVPAAMIVPPRTLPWKKQPTGEQKDPIILDKVIAAPTPANKKAANFLNTTASTVKQQIKQHREEAARKVIKKAGTTESIAAAKLAKKRVPRVFLSEEQQHVLNLVVEQKESVFFTGSAGTGKSVLLREIITALRKKYSREPDRIAVTASTGLAACNVGGVTLHSFAGIGLGKEEVPELVKKIKRNQKARHRWLRTKILVVDELSMVDGQLFDKLEGVARQLRNNGRPFGGIQLVVTGDFFQLPPVPEGYKAATFAFDAATWPNVIPNVIGLHQVFRQKDPVFAGMLNEMREGKLSEASIKAFQALDREMEYKDDLTATELFPLRSEVEKANNARLSSLVGKQFTYEARDGGTIQDKVQRDRLLANCMAPERIILKKGAQVMLIKNIDETLVNGSIGTVVAFMDETQFDKHSLDEELFPEQDDGTLASQIVTEGREDQAKRRLLDNLATTSRTWPLVRFSIPDGTTRDLLCQPEVWKTELPNGEVQASRSQIPLILSWALSIHKAQGQTLDRVSVDLAKVFEKGQAYVALSRATSMAGLRVKNFSAGKVSAHAKVIEFYANLARYNKDEVKTDVKPDFKPPQARTEYERRFAQDNSNV